MLLTYLYDGSFEGFLTCIYDSYYTANKPDEIVSASDYEPTLINHPVSVITDNLKAGKVYEAIKTKISEDSLIHIFSVFQSSMKNRESLLYKYIRLGFNLGSKLDLHLHNEIVHEVHKMSRRVGLETHRMLGFIRFAKLKNDVYYSTVEPDHNILVLIAPHFAERLSDQNWLIHDIKREIAVMYNKTEWVLIPLKKTHIEISTDDELCFYETLWKDYFEHIAIHERKNIQLQKRMMPARYWKHLTEFCQP